MSSPTTRHAEAEAGPSTSTFDTHDQIPIPIPSNHSPSIAKGKPHRPLPPLPFPLQALILSHLLPPLPPLPLHALSPLFRHRLTYLSPEISEMDRQLSLFPLPFTSEVLVRKLEELAGRGYTLGKEKYAWDGECGVARRGVRPEAAEEKEDLEDLEMHYLYDLHDGWGFHGLRTTLDSDNMGLEWVEDPSEVDISPGSTDSTTSSSSDPSSGEYGNGNGNGSLDPYAYTSSTYSSYPSYPNDATSFSDPSAAVSRLGDQDQHREQEQEVADYWAGFSPPPSPPLLASTTADGMGLDEDERERLYWAQYADSAAASKSGSPVLSRRESRSSSGVFDGAQGSSMVGLLNTLEDKKDIVEGVGGVSGVTPAVGGHDAPANTNPSGGSISITRDRSGTIRPADHHHHQQQQLQQQETSGSDSRLNGQKSISIQHPTNVNEDHDESAKSLSLNSPPLSPRLHARPKSNSSDGGDSMALTLLRDRLRMKTLSLLRRAWLSFIKGCGRQDELEEKGMRWLSLARQVGAVKGTGMKGHANGYIGQQQQQQQDEEEEGKMLLVKLELLWEMYEVYADTDAGDGPGAGANTHKNTDDGVRDRFYRLVEQAMGEREREQGENGSGQEGARDLQRNYSFDQEAYWES